MRLLEPRSGQCSSPLHSVLMLKCRIPAQTNRVWKGRTQKCSYTSFSSTPWKIRGPSASGEAWTDISKHHIICRHFELEIQPETWKAIPGLCGCSPALCLAQRMELETQPPSAHTPQPLPSAPCGSSHLPSLTFPSHCSALQASTTPSLHKLNSPCPSLPYIPNCSSRQGVPSNNTMPASREEEYLGIRV